jgi:membrane protease YdiL (CAAX protease family)
VLVVLVVDATLTVIRGVGFLRYVITGSRFALGGVVLWLGLSAVSLFLFRRFRDWTAAGFPRRGRAVAIVVYAYLLFALAFGLTLENLAGMARVDWLADAGDEPNRGFTAVGLTVATIVLVVASMTIRSIAKSRGRVDGTSRPSKSMADSDPNDAKSPVPSTPAPVSGRGPGGVIRRHPLGAFFVLAYVFSWSYWLSVVFTGGDLSHFPGLLGPMFAAFTVDFLVQGGAGVRSLLSRMFRWRVPLRWYLAALVPAATGAIGMAIVALAGNGWPAPEELSIMPGLPAAGFVGVLVLVLMVNGYGEEVGWRGFAWARLRERHGVAPSAGLLGLVWAGWHIPTFWIDTGMNLDWFMIPGWVIGLMAGSVVLGWLYERAGSSLLIVALFHTFLNMASATAATEGVPAALTTAAVILWAVMILRREHSQRSRSPGRATASVEGAWSALP